jgi:hypothetical protein
MHKRYIYGNGRALFLHETTGHADTTCWVVARKDAFACALPWGARTKETAATDIVTFLLLTWSLDMGSRRLYYMDFYTFRFCFSFSDFNTRKIRSG